MSLTHEAVVQAGTYGIEVMVEGGKHRGKLGIIDDWDEETDPPRAIVYLDGASIACGDQYRLISMKHLRMASPFERKKLAERQKHRMLRFEKLRRKQSASP